jgi:integrase/recombinase XerD
MKNQRVNLTKRVQTDAGLRYCPVVQAANGRIRPDWVVVGDGKENIRQERVTGGAYYMEWREGGKRKRLSVGPDAAQAQARRLRKLSELNAISNGIALADSEDAGTRRLLDTAIAEFLEETKLSKKPKTFAAYSKTMAYFRESCTKVYLEDIDRMDMLRFAAFLKEKKQAPRSVWNKFNNVMSFLKANGIRGIVNKNDWPKFTQEEPEVYEKDDLDKLFAACEPGERLLFEFYLMTGMREQEVIYTTWNDVSFTRQTVTVRWKPDYGWTPKNFKEREIPIPEKLVKELKAAKLKAKTCPLVFHTSGCLPKFDALHILKATAKRAELNADAFWLHKFRSTFATWSLWAGVDLRTVQNWMGHVDMESTMRYLKPSRSQAVRDKVNQIFA